MTGELGIRVLKRFNAKEFEAKVVSIGAISPLSLANVVVFLAPS